MLDFNRTIVAEYLFLLNGFLHIIGGIFAIGFLEVSVTWFIFTGFFLIWGIPTLRLTKSGELDSTKQIIIGCSTISFLNFFTNLIIILTENFEERFFLYYFILAFIIIDILVFPFVFKKKVKIDRMKRPEILSYFSIVLIKGLGINLLFQSLRYLGWPPEISSNIVIIIYIAIFGTINTILGNNLYSDNENKKLQITSLILLCLGLSLGIILFPNYPNINFLLLLILYVIVIIIRVVYLSINYNKFSNIRQE